MSDLIRVSDLQSKLLFSDVKIFGLGDIYTAELHFSGDVLDIPVGSYVRSLVVSSISSHIFDGKSYVVLHVW